MFYVTKDYFESVFEDQIMTYNMLLTGNINENYLYKRFGWENRIDIQIELCKNKNIDIENKYIKDIFTINHCNYEYSMDFELKNIRLQYTIMD